MSDRSYVNSGGVVLSLDTTPTSAINTIWAASPGVETTAVGGGHTLYGDSGDDDFVIFTPTDQVVIPATHGIYTITDSAWDAAYTLPTGINNLIVNGGDQVATGNAQANLIITGSGEATVSGGGGDDVFVLGTGDDTVVDPQGSGSDEIYWFNPAIDHIRLDGSTQFSDWNGIQSALQQVGSAVVLNMGNAQTLTFQGETLANFSSSNFYLPINTASLNLTFDDEFNSFVSSPNGSVGWMTSWPYGGINNRALPANGDNTYYSDASVGVNPLNDINGVLNLTATVAPAGNNPDNLPYDSGVMTTYKSEAQLYGYFEINCKLPTGQGLWPSFYMQPYDNSAELDIFEILGISPTTLHATATDWTTRTSTTSSLVIPNSSTGFHPYGVDWEPTTVTFYMDGNVIFSAPTPASMHVPMYMIVAMGVGAPGSWAEAPLTNSIFPAAMQINYVRAYATAATQDVGGTAAIAQPIAIMSATTAVTTTDTGSIKPFAGIVITDANAAQTETPADPGATQTETATVTLSSTLNGTLSDPNAATDGSALVNGVWTMSGSSAAVATALDGLVFTPAANLVVPGGTDTTAVTATITDAGETASTTSKVTITGLTAPITITPATEAVATTDAASVNPFAGVVLTDANAGQTETITVTSSDAANGTLFDPNAASDGSTLVNGVWVVSGSCAVVAGVLDGLVFRPTAHQVAPDAAVATTLTATLRDTAGESASATADITATAVAPPVTTTGGSSSPDTLTLNISEDNWNGDAKFIVDVNGERVGGHYSSSVLHASGDAGVVLLTGNWGSGVQDVQVRFINDAYGGTASTDRNLYINSIAYDGATYANTSGTLMSNGADKFAVGGSTPTTTAPADTLTLSLSEDAYKGNADFVLFIDGKAVTSPQVVSALKDAGSTQSFTLTGDLGAGKHTIGIAFTNDFNGGSPTTDRNLYVDGVTMNGSSVFSGVDELDTNSTVNYMVTTSH
jgi:beta-glucanase (GH16 family)